MTTDRRTFFKQLGALALCAMSGPGAIARQINDVTRRRLTILHVNDVHSHIDPMPLNDSRYPGMGGYARRQAYIEQVIAEGNDVMVFECGDMFQGTPYFNFYKGKLEIELMNRMHVDAVTIGNHEFDNGLDVLCDRMEEAKFPFINSNYTFVDQRARNIVKPYKIFERAGIKVGVFGLGVAIEGLITAKNAKNTIYNDPIAATQRMADTLRAEGCNLVIGLSHIGFDMGRFVDDQKVAAATRGVDMILGGHSHTFLPAPVYVKNLDGADVLVNQVGYAGINVGRIDLDVCGGDISVVSGYAKVMV